MSKRDPTAGLTLIETMITIAVIGIATGSVVLGLNRLDRNVRAETEAVRLARNLSTAVDEALVSGRSLQLLWDGRGYSFVQLQGAAAAWGPADMPVLAARHDLDPALRMTTADTGETPVLIAASASAPMRRIEVEGLGAPWLVHFDGLSAQAFPRGSP